MTRSLITGGFGFIGRHLALMLADAGHEVTLFDVVQDPAFLEKGNGRIKAIRGSLANWSEVLDVVVATKPECIFHSGAMLPPASETSPQAAFEVNIVGTYNILEASRLLNVSRLIYASTMTSFGPDSPPLVPNDYAQHPLSMYGTSKVCNERLGEYYHRRFGLDFRSVRFPAIVGPGRASSAGWTAYTSVAIEASAKGQPFTIRADRETTTDILYVKDAAHSMIDLASAEASRLTRRCYNLHGHLVTAGELAEAIKRVVPGAQLTFAPDPVIVEGIKTMPRQLDDSMAREDWGWRPRYSLDESIADFVAVVRNT